jgi:hypothetical protein
MRGEEPSKWTSSNTKRLHLGEAAQSDLTRTFSGAAETAVNSTFLHWHRRNADVARKSHLSQMIVVSSSMFHCWLFAGINGL